MEKAPLAALHGSDASRIYRESAANDLARIETTGVMGNVADQMRNAVTVGFTKVTVLSTQEEPFEPSE